MPELPELEVVQEVLNRLLLGQTITLADAIPQGDASVMRDRTGEGLNQALSGARFEESHAMPKPTAKPLQISADELLRDLPPEISSIIAELRSIIRLTIPDASEKVNMGWRSLNYSHPHVGYFCGLFPFPDRVDVAFEFGILLADPAGFFDNRGKQVGFARIRSLKDIRRTPFKHMLRAAVSLPADRSTRLALVRSGSTLQVPKKKTKRPKRTL